MGIGEATAGSATSPGINKGRALQCPLWRMLYLSLVTTPVKYLTLRPDLPAPDQPRIRHHQRAVARERVTYKKKGHSALGGRGPP